MPTFSRTLSSLAVLSLLCSTVSVSAQDSGMQQAMNTAPALEAEQITLTVGEILEVLPSNSFASPVYSWILTQDRTFLQAARTPSFRYRFIQPGTYSLIAEITSGDGTQSAKRTFTVTAKARNPGDIAVSATASSMSSASDSSLTGIVKLDPPMDQNERVTMQSNVQLLKLTPLSTDQKPLSLDMDITVDADGDGNPANDVQNQGTFFQLYAEPLYVWFTEPITNRSMSVTTLAQDGSARMQRIEIVTADYAQQQGIVVSPIRITSTPTGNGAYTFSAVAGNTAPQSTSLLYQWTFGDGQESLIMNPSHTYAADGNYTVTLEVKNLIDGQDVAKDQQQIMVQGAGTVASSASSQATETPAGPSFLSKLPITSILIGLGIFILFVVLGMGAVFLLGKLRGGKSLDQTFADMEKSIAPKDGETKAAPALVIPATASVTPKPAAPAASPAPTKEDFVKREENAASNPPPAATARIDEKAAPDWLKKGLDAAPKPATPAPAPAAPKPTPVPTPAPAPVAPKPAPAPAPAATPAPTPAWLQTPKPAAPTPAPAAPKPAPTPAPAAMPAPAPVKPATPPAPVQPPVPPVAPKPAAMPTPVASIPTPVAPKPVVAPTPVPAPIPTAPAPLPTPPVPAPVKAPTPPVVPAPVPVVPSTPAPAPAPTMPTPAPVAPKPIVPVVPVSAPAPAPVASIPVPVAPPKPQPPVVPIVQPTPVVPAAPAPVVTPPAAVPTPTVPTVPPADVAPKAPETPIAFIRADSLDQGEQKPL